MIDFMKNGVKATYVPLFATKRGSYNTGAAEFPTHPYDAVS